MGAIEDRVAGGVDEIGEDDSVFLGERCGLPQKFLDHAGIVQNFLLSSLTHLQLARAYAISGDTAKAKAAYQDFLTLWKDADPDIPAQKNSPVAAAEFPS
jgi:hypothetical protein